MARKKCIKKEIKIDSFNGEKWKSIFDYYLVSNLGRIYSLKRKFFLRGYMGNLGYLYVGITNSQLNNKRMFLHRVIAMAFIPNPHNKRTVNHIDGNKLNNYVTNLEWATYKEQSDHAKKLKLNNYQGLKDANEKRKKKIVQKTLDGEFIKVWDSLCHIRNELGYSPGNLTYAVNKKKGFTQAYGFKWEYLTEYLSYNSITLPS